MGLLDKLWDDVVAGPQPEMGLRRLRTRPMSFEYSVKESSSSPVSTFQGFSVTENARLGATKKPAEPFQRTAPTISDWLVISILDR